jgi:glycogen debranching enzyme
MYRERSVRLKQQFNEQFWLPERGYFAIALDKDKLPVDAYASERWALPNVWTYR